MAHDISASSANSITLVNTYYAPLRNLSIICRDEKMNDIQKISIEMLMVRQEVEIDLKTKVIEIRVDCDLSEILRAPFNGKEVSLTRKPLS